MPWHCTNPFCCLPLNPDAAINHTISGQRVCQPCFFMFTAIYQNPYWQKIQAEYKAEVEAIQKLKFGAADQ